MRFCRSARFANNSSRRAIELTLKGHHKSHGLRRQDLCIFSGNRRVDK